MRYNKTYSVCASILQRGTERGTDWEGQQRKRTRVERAGRGSARVGHRRDQYTNDIDPTLEKDWPDLCLQVSWKVRNNNAYAALHLRYYPGKASCHVGRPPRDKRREQQP